MAVNTGPGEGGAPQKSAAPAKKAAAKTPAKAAPKNDVVDIITRVAKELGVPPALALSIAYHESGLNPNVTGDNGTSFGLFQLHQGGELGSHSAEWARNPENNARTALAVVAHVMRANPNADWGTIAAMAQRPADPSGYAASINGISQNVTGDPQTYFRGHVTTTAATSSPSLDTPKDMTVQQYLADPVVAQKYGYLSAYLKNPEIAKVIADAAKNGWGSDEMFGELQKTHWWQSTTDSQRAWDYEVRTDRKSADAKLAQVKAQAGDMAQSLGVGLDDQRLTRLSITAISDGWSNQQLRDAITAEWHYKPGTVSVGATGSAIHDLKALSDAYLVPISDQTLGTWAQKIAAGHATAKDFEGYVAEQAKSLFPTMAAAIDKGLTPQQYADPYKQIAAKLLDTNPDSIDFTQPKWQRALMQIDPKTGERTAMNLADWQKTLMTDPSYGFDTTSTARQQSADFVAQLGSMFGFQK